jgi:hypothetical protein
MSPKFTKTSVRKSEGLGEKLSKKRAALGYEIKDVERATKIRAKYLEYIEAGEWSKLPPDVFVRGFLKSYAVLLRLNPEKVILIYLKEKGLKENVGRIVKKEPETKKPKKTSKIIITPKNLTLISLSLLGITVLSYIGWQISILAAPPKIDLVSPIDNQKIEDDETIVEGRTDAGASVFINNVPIGVSPDGFFKETIGLQDGINLIRIKAVNRLERITEIERTIVANPPAIKSSEETDIQLLVKIEVGPESSTVYVIADDKPITSENNVMLPGSSQSIKAKEKVTIKASDGGSVRVSINGKDLGQLGESGQSVEKTFTKESI